MIPEIKLIITIAFIALIQFGIGFFVGHAVGWVSGFKKASEINESYKKEKL